MVPIPRLDVPSPERSAAFIGAVAPLPISAMMNWFPNSETTVGAGMMMFGAVTVGIVAAARSVGSDAAGLCAGFLGGALELVIFTVTTGTTVV